MTNFVERMHAALECGRVPASKYGSIRAGCYEHAEVWTDLGCSVAVAAAGVAEDLVEEALTRRDAQRREVEAQALRNFADLIDSRYPQDIWPEMGAGDHPHAPDRIAASMARAVARQARTEANAVESGEAPKRMDEPPFGAADTRCCQWHNENCEGPSELCCDLCTEIDHPQHREIGPCSWRTE